MRRVIRFQQNTGMVGVNRDTPGHLRIRQRQQDKNAQGENCGYRFAGQTFAHLHFRNGEAGG